MDIIKEVFKKCIPNRRKLLAYGFNGDETLIYQKEFLDGFKAIIKIKEEKIEAKVIELDLDEEYTALNVSTQTGSFVTQVRNAYISLLEDIKDKCFDKTYFSSRQADRIASMIYKEFNDEPIFMFDDKANKDTGVFKDPRSNKWYAIIMYISYQKLGIDRDEEVDVINVKLNEDMIDSLVENDGYHRAYHMNKKHWLTIRLDDTVDDEVIMALVDISHSFFEYISSSWLIPSSNKFFDVESYCDDSDIITWHKRKGINKGDMAYLYIGAPISAIMYAYKVIDISDREMVLKKVHKYPKGAFSFEVIKSLGVTSVRSIRRISKELEAKLASFDHS